MNHDARQACVILDHTIQHRSGWIVCCALACGLLVSGAACSPGAPRTRSEGALPTLENVSQAEAAEMLTVIKEVWTAVQTHDDTTMRRYVDDEDVLQLLPEFREDSAAMLTPASSLTIISASRQVLGIDTVSTVIGLPYRACPSTSGSTRQATVGFLFARGGTWRIVGVFASSAECLHDR